MSIIDLLEKGNNQDVIIAINLLSKMEDPLSYVISNSKTIESTIGREGIKIIREDIHKVPIIEQKYWKINEDLFVFCAQQTIIFRKKASLNHGIPVVKP